MSKQLLRARLSEAERRVARLSAGPISVELGEALLLLCGTTVGPDPARDLPPDGLAELDELLGRLSGPADGRAGLAEEIEGFCRRRGDPKLIHEFLYEMPD